MPSSVLLEADRGKIDFSGADSRLPVADFPTEPERPRAGKVPPLPTDGRVSPVPSLPPSPPSLPDERATPGPSSLRNAPDELVDGLHLTLADPDAADEDSELGPVLAALTSATTVSFFSSATFHLLAIGSVVVISPLLGLEWLKLDDDPPVPLMATLGDEEIAGEMPQFEFIGDLSDQFDKPASSIEQMARQLQQSDSAALLMAQDDVLRSVVGSDSEDPEDDGAGVLLKVPESGLAVTKGSFTAFTIPANPKPREVYSIVIEVRLPDDVKKFRVNDLVGEVKGSDGYRQKIPYDSRAPMAAGFPAENNRIVVLESSTVLDVVKNRVQIVIKVPGAARMVKDEIRIRSRKLKEEQEITLVFGLNRNADTPD